MKRAMMVVLTTILLAGLCAGCASAPADYADYVEVEAAQIGSPDNYKGPKWFKFQSKLDLDRIWSVYVGLPGGFQVRKNDRFFSELEQLKVRVEEGKVYTVYATKVSHWGEEPYFRVDNIEGLLSIEEGQAKIAAKAAAKKKAMEENFIFYPSGFDPDSYTKADLFKAAAASENLSIAATRMDALTNHIRSLGIIPYVANFASDVTFDAQRGTKIQFSSDDRAISQIMSIDKNAGLRAGQKVRVYYMITRSPLTTWEVDAIERR